MNHRVPCIVALLSLTLLALELVWTRLFSAEFFYTYAFLALSLAILGLGLGALAVRLLPRLGGEGALGPALLLVGLAALTGPPLVFQLGIDFAKLLGGWGMLGNFALMLLLLGSSFFFGGVALAGVFRRHVDAMPRLYAADLVGAGAGVLLAILGMNRLGTPAAAVWVVLPVAVAAWLATRGWQRLLPLVLLALAVLGSGRSATLLEAPRRERAPVVYKHWDAMAKIKLYAYPDGARGINIDNVANSPVLPFDGDWEALRRDLGPEGWDIDVGWLVAQFDSCTFLSLGSGGGSDVLQALEQGATSVHAVEVNAHVNRMMQDGDPSGYTVHDSTVVDSAGRIITCAALSGHLYRDPRVRVVSEDARTYVRRHPGTFDVIFSLSSNTWAALGSGSFALAENYLFTTEAFEDYWRALTPGGFMSLEHQMYMPRLVSEVIDALTRLGVAEPRQHFAVYDLPKLRRNLLLLSKRPLDDEIRRNAYKAMADGRHDFIQPLYPAPDSLQDNLVHRIVTNGWRAERDSARIAISPCTDDRPFVAQLGLWRNFDRGKLGEMSSFAEFRGFPLSKLVLLAILGVVVVSMIPVLVLPYFVSRQKLPAAAWAYFFCIGVAFMAVEVVLIQKYTLFVGASSYSTATILLALLVTAGIGSRLSDRVGAGAAFAGLLVWLVLEAFVLRTVTGALAGLALAPRAVVAALLVAPLGFFMGMPFPKGARRVGEAVDWGFAVNGVASVVGGTAVVLAAVTWGFTATLVLAGFFYLAAGGLLAWRRAW